LLNEEKIRDLYSSLNLGESCIDKIIETHKKVLCLGESNKFEHAGVICCETEKINYFTDNHPTRVSYECHSNKNYIVIHNHPKSTPFSPQDLYEFQEKMFHRCLSIQGHDGTAYVLYRESENSIKMTKNEISEFFARVKNLPEHVDLSNKAKKEIAGETIAHVMGWQFIKEEVA